MIGLGLFNSVFRNIGIAVAVSASIISSANAAILFENPFSGQDTGYYSSSSAGYRVYDRFSLSGNSVLTGFQFSTYNSSYVPISFDVTIFSDSTFLNTLYSQSFNIGSATLTVDGLASLIEVALPSISLAAGDYWISPWSTSGNSLAINLSNPTVDGSMIHNTVGNLGEDMAMRIYGNEGNVVPEPTSLALLGIGLAGLAVRRRKQRTA